MSPIHAIILGITQGLSEFLPISSSGHLILIRDFFAIDDPGISFDVIQHTGTLMALFLYFRKELREIAKDFVKLRKSINDTRKKGEMSRDEKVKSTKLKVKNCIEKEKIRKGNNSGSRKNISFHIHNIQNTKLTFIVIATIPAGLIGFFGKSFFENHFRSEFSVSCFLIITGGILFLAEFITKRFHRNNQEPKRIGIYQSVVIGIAQCFAIIPGISRSGVTISTAKILGINKKESAKFSFLLLIPLVLGATLLSLSDITHNEMDVSIDVLTIGFLTSFLTSFFAIKFFLASIQKIDFRWFAVYLWIIGGIGIILQFAN